MSENEELYDEVLSKRIKQGNLCIICGSSDGDVHPPKDRCSCTAKNSPCFAKHYRSFCRTWQNRLAVTPAHTQLPYGSQHHLPPFCQVWPDSILWQLLYCRHGCAILANSMNKISINMRSMNSARVAPQWCHNALADTGSLLHSPTWQ